MTLAQLKSDGNYSAPFDLAEVERIGKVVDESGYSTLSDDEIRLYTNFQVYAASNRITDEEFERLNGQVLAISQGQQAIADATDKTLSQIIASKVPYVRLSKGDPQV